LQDPPKFTQIWIFGLKTNHLATLSLTRGRFFTCLPYRVKGRRCRTLDSVTKLPITNKSHEFTVYTKFTVDNTMHVVKFYDSNCLWQAIHKQTKCMYTYTQQNDVAPMYSVEHTMLSATLF
jgi:hypothetical protein